MRVAIFGADGRTGRFVVDEALRRGHEVTALVRDAADAAFPDEVRVVVGDARDRGASGDAISGVAAVLSAMGPFGDDPGTVYSDAIGSLTTQMAAAGVRRLAILANARVLDDRPLGGPFAAVSEEHRRALATLHATNLEWTVLATPLLSDDPASSSYDAVIDGAPPGEAIPRADFALALVDALDHPDWVSHAVGVSG